MSTIINNHSNPDQMADLKKALDRALNTWDDGPRWLFDLCDAMDKGAVRGFTFYVDKEARDKIADLPLEPHIPVYKANVMLGRTPYRVQHPVSFDQAVNRFLGWKLPEDFSPDNGVQFKPPSFGWPTGTNLLNAEQARQMFGHCLGITK